MEVAEDALLELGYDAAAYELKRSNGHTYGARNALEILETGPPSIYLDTYLVFRKPIYHLGVPGMRPAVVARAVGEHSLPWYRFIVGKAVHDRGGHWVGWDENAGYTFQSRFKTLTEARRYPPR